MARPREYQSDEERREANAARMREARAAVARAQNPDERAQNPRAQNPPVESSLVCAKPACAKPLPQDAEARRIALAWQHVAAQHGVEVSMDSLLAAVARGRAAVTRDDVQAAKRLLGKSTSTCLENQST